MPTYDYRCEANGRVVEVKHAMSEDLASWGELCDRAGIDPGDTPREAAISRLSTGGQFIGGERFSTPEPACTTGACCPTGVCGLN